MRYLDTGSRQVGDTLGSWLSQEANGSVAEFRLQAGFYSAGGLGPVVGMLQAMSARDAPVKFVLGSNNCETLGSDVEILARLMALPRNNGHLGIVSYSNALFHPKTYHFCRNDGSQAAYVGSANLGRSAVSGRHIEAGILLDEHEGDSIGVLNAISDAVDHWFVSSPLGMETIGSPGDVAHYVQTGLLAAARPPKSGSNNSLSVQPAAAKLSPLVSLPTVPKLHQLIGVPNSAQGNTNHPAQPSVQLPSYPSYLNFAPNTQGPTNGAGAVSGVQLPNSAVGLIIRLNKDSARYWNGGDGTANISIPVLTVETLRFGFNAGGKPSAELPLEARFIGSTIDKTQGVVTSIMAYGYGPGSTGHKDIRMVLPKPSAEAVAHFASTQNAQPPAPGDYAMLEWPTVSRPTFRLSILDNTSQLYGTLLSLVAQATQSRTLVGRSSCWLPPLISPNW